MVQNPLLHAVNSAYIVYIVKNANLIHNHLKTNKLVALGLKHVRFNASRFVHMRL